MRTKNEQEFVRDKIRQLLGRGKTQRQISEIMKISLGKTNSIVQSLKEEAKENIAKYVNEELPAQYQNTLSGINQIIAITWNSIDSATNERDKNNAMSLLMQAYAMRLDLLSSADTLSAAVKFVDTHNIIRDNELQKKPA